MGDAFFFAWWVVFPLHIDLNSISLNGVVWWVRMATSSTVLSSSCKDKEWFNRLILILVVKPYVVASKWARSSSF